MDLATWMRVNRITETEIAQALQQPQSTINRAKRRRGVRLATGLLLSLATGRQVSVESLVDPEELEACRSYEGALLEYLRARSAPEQASG